VFDWTTIFGAELLWSALPFIILLGSLANERIDDDLSRHIGLNSPGADIVRGLFRNTPTHDVLAIATGLLFAFAGVIAVVSSLHVLYERVFDLEHRGWRDLPRYLAYVAILLGVLVAEGSITGPERRAAGPVTQAILSFVVVAIFFAWTMHFLLDRRGAMAARDSARPRHRASLARAFLLLLCLLLLGAHRRQQNVRNDRRRIHVAHLVHPHRHSHRARRRVRWGVATTKRGSTWPGNARPESMNADAL
jgi:hypothetical protein